MKGAMNSDFPPESEDIHAHIRAIEFHVGKVAKGLPYDVFLLASRLTPMVNVDLLIRNERGEILLTWRSDEFYGPGWHIPGGIVRFKEALASRIHAVVATELGTTVDFTRAPLAVNEIMSTRRDTRGHFISLLYECVLTGYPNPQLKYSGGEPIIGQWAWHCQCPENLISVHQIYKPYFAGAGCGETG